MPRRRPGKLRAETAYRNRLYGDTSLIRNVSPQVLADIGRLEYDRAGLGPEAVYDALHRWRGFVREWNHRFPAESEGCGIAACCGDPWESRRILEDVLGHLRGRRAREFRVLVQRADEEF